MAYEQTRARLLEYEEYRAQPHKSDGPKRGAERAVREAFFEESTARNWIDGQHALTLKECQRMPFDDILKVVGYILGYVETRAALRMYYDTGRSPEWGKKVREAYVRESPTPIEGIESITPSDAQYVINGGKRMEMRGGWWHKLRSWVVRLTGW